MLRTLGAPQRRLLDRRRRRPRKAKPSDPDPAPVPTARAGVVGADPLGSEEEACAWLDRLRADPTLLRREVTEAARGLNRLMHAHRAAAVDPYARDLRPDAALAIRVGHGTGEQVADGRFTAALEAPIGTGRKRRMERLSPQERLAAIVGGRDQLLASDELVLRARADLDAGRGREAALQTRIALECVLEELDDGDMRELGDALRDDRETVSSAAMTALSAEPAHDVLARVEAAVGRMESALRRHRARPP